MPLRLRFERESKFPVGVWRGGGMMSVFSQEKRYRTSLPASQQQEICSDAAAPALDPACWRQKT